jgi:hypothetical protein
MAIKYECPKCERRFVEWGAKKLNFLCPDCNVPLERLGTQVSDQIVTEPSLGRRTKRTEELEEVSGVVPDLGETDFGALPIPEIADAADVTELSTEDLEEPFVAVDAELGIPIEETAGYPTLPDAEEGDIAEEDVEEEE